MDRFQITSNAEIAGTYRLVSVLGEGGAGAVWDAEHLRLPKRVAIKFLLGTGAKNPEIVARFRREAEIACRLQHPNIVEVYDYNTLPDGTPYLVMEKLSGLDLRARLSQGPMGLREAVPIIRQMVSALALAHRKQVVHRDLKPENVFLSREADGGTRVKVLDFGISKVEHGQTFVTRDDALLGTPSYMAPEQAMGRNSAVDCRSDLFSLGAIVYEMLTGAVVFGGTNLFEVVRKVTEHDPMPLREVLATVPAGISAAVSTALSKSPGDRQASVQEFFAAFDTEPEAGAAIAPTLPGDSGMSSAFDSRPSSGGAALMPTGFASSSSSVAAAATLPSSSGEIAAVGASSSATMSPDSGLASAGMGTPAGPLPTTVLPAEQTRIDDARPSGGRWAWAAGAGLATVGAIVGVWAVVGLGGGGPDRPDGEALDASGVAVPVVVPQPGADAQEDRTSLWAEATGPVAQPRATGPEPNVPHEGDLPIATGDAPPSDEEADAGGPSEEDVGTEPESDPPESDRASSRPRANTHRARPPEAESNRVPAKVLEARAALQRGDFRAALQLARASLRDESSMEAYEVMMKAYCGQHDVGMARAMSHKVRGAARRRARQYCRERDVGLP